MANASISSVFDIVLTGADMNVAKTFIAPRAFTVVGIEVLNIAAGASTLTITRNNNDGAGALALTAATVVPPIAGAGTVQGPGQVGPTAPVSVLVANAKVAAGAAVVVTTGAVTDTKVVLHCVAHNGQSIPIA